VSPHPGARVTSTWTIRPIRDGDAAAVAALTGQLGYPVAVDELRSRVRAVAERGGAAILVAADDADRAIGWIHVAMAPLLEESATATIQGLVIDEDHRSAGVGADLVAAAERWARDNGARRLTVRTRTTRRRAHRFYERLGFGEVKRSVVYARDLE